VQYYIDRAAGFPGAEEPARGRQVPGVRDDYSGVLGNEQCSDEWRSAFPEL